jgi:7-carboxy-7-deazaguanine synthase
MDKDAIRFSEIFRSFQGEGEYTGIPSAWLRFFMCNLQCNGFGQKDPTDPSTYKLPWQEFDANSVDKLEDLPVWQFGCDSSYSWAKKFQHLTHSCTPTDICNEIRAVLKSGTNPEGTFLNPTSGQETHMCFTGGEPMLRKHQIDMVNIVEEFKNQDNAPNFITIETNGTQTLTEEFKGYFGQPGAYQGELFFSLSPKLFTVSGEQNKKAIKPSNVAEYNQLTNRGQLKFVLGNQDRQWEELLDVISQFRAAGVIYPVWIMPVGAREEEQHNIAALVSDRAMDHGFNVAARVHTYVYGNVIGT